MKQKYLLIVESSSKCGAIEKYLGPEYKCIASNGHIRVLADGLKSIDTKNGYEPHYSVDPEKKTHVQKMAAIISDFDKANVIIATDHDREGEAIGWHICQVFDLPVATCRRIVFHEITKPALQCAIKNPGIINMNLVYAAIARQVLDVLVGYKVSPLLWKYVAQGTGLSAGRCQTPALRLVAETESGNESSCVKHRIKGCFFPPHNITMELDTEFDTELEVLDYLNVSSSNKFTFELGAKKVSERSAPKPLNTSAVLQLASNMLHMGAKETMACCQTLYQLGHITYMRTDNRTYSPEFIATCSKFITDNWSEKHIGSVLPVNTDANCPHEAIRVTNVQLKDLVLVADHNTKGIEKLYKLIWLNTVQSCMANATYNVYPLTVHGPLGYKFKHGLETAVFLGHKVLDNIKPESSATTVQSLILKMQTTANKEATYTYLESVPHLSVGNRHYTEAGLISKLEELGIGRPSTYSTIIDTILTRKYVEKADVPGTTIGCNIYTLRPSAKLPPVSEEVSVATVQKTFGAERGKLVLEPVGKIVVEFLVDKFAELFSYDFTRNMEEQLDQVAAGTLQWQKVCDECNKKIKSITKLEKKVYPVDDTWSLMFSKNGPALYNKGTKEFRSVKRGLKLDIGALEQGKYTFDDLAQMEERVLNDVTTIKCGKFGLYAEIAKEDGTVDNVSLQHLKKPIEDIVLEDIPVKDATATGPKTVLRTLTPSLSIRNGKYGPYIYYQTPKMKKPKFYDLKGFNQGFGVCDADELVAWIQHKYGIV